MVHSGALAIVTIIFLAVIQNAKSTSNHTVSPSPANFWPQLNKNITMIQWKHAVNSQALLVEALAADNVHMIEADVVVDANNKPIMAHPPLISSDLDLEKFLEQVIKNKTKGIKLDFKTIEAFDASKEILAKHRNNLTFPVWLNADVVKGPVEAVTTPVDAERFISGAIATVPECTLSLGWTTRYGNNESIHSGNYTDAQITDMQKIVLKHAKNQSVTYAVRAGIVANQTVEMQKLLKETTKNNPTLTIWSSSGDVVNATNLSNFIKTVGIEKVYVDVPKELMDMLKLSENNAPGTTSSLVVSASVLLASFMANFVLSRK